MQQTPNYAFNLPEDTDDPDNADFNANFTKVDTEMAKLLPKTGGTLTGQLVAQTNTAYTTAQLRNVKFKQGTVDFTTAELAVGEIGFLYT